MSVLRLVLPVGLLAAVSVSKLAKVAQPRDGNREGGRGGGEAGAARQDPGRGREASSPTQMPAAGWRDVLMRVKDEISRDNLSIIAAGVGFYALLSLFPALTAIVSIYGLVADPAQVQGQLESLGGMVPEAAQPILQDQLAGLAQGSQAGLGVGLLVSLALALWSAAAAVKTLMTAMNVAYGEEEKRSFIRYNATALALTLGGVLFIVFAMGLLVVLPALFGMLNLGSGAQWAMSLLRWPLLFIGICLALAVIYRFGPSRSKPRWQWVSWGAAIGAALWLLGSAGFSIYVSSFGSYQETYGALAGVIILLMWFWVSAFAVLIGAEVNAELEHQTRRDTTVDGERPLGGRQAEMADTVAATP